MHEVQGVFGYLRTLLPIQRDRLYGKDGSPGAPWACKAVFQSLLPVAKCYVMRLLWLEGGVRKEEVLDQWVLDCGRNEHEAAIEEMQELGILHFDESTGVVQLNPWFKRNMQFALANPQAPWFEAKRQLKPDSNPPTLETLENHMMNSWDQVLYFMTGGFEATQGQVAVPPVIENFLVQTGLVQPDPRTGVLEPTNAGFEFMLRDIHEQVWTYVFETIQRNREHAQELLSFLFALSYCEVGQDYPVSELSTVQQMLMREFCELGILYMRKPGSRRFYPTPLAVNLMFGAEPALRQAGPTAVQRMPTRKRMSIIVQTNFQVIAYVTSKLHLGMLSLFVNIKIRLPNAAIGVLTRSSVKDAMRMGITSEQILNFLRMHADPLVWNKPSVLPDNVMDQIVIWENESRRIHAQPGILIDYRQVVERNPEKRNEFATMHELVKSAGMCLWEDLARCMMVVSEEGAKQLEQLRRSAI